MTSEGQETIPTKLLAFYLSCIRTNPTKKKENKRIKENKEEQKGEKKNENQRRQKAH